MPLKRRNYSTPATLHARNGGSNTSFLPHDAPALNTLAGSDTEEDENSEEIEQRYLNTPVDDSNRQVSTVFGPGVDVWKSYYGTVYAEVNDETMKKARETGLWQGHSKEVGGEGRGEKKKRKRNSESEGLQATGIDFDPHPEQKSNRNRNRSGNRDFHSHGKENDKYPPSPRHCSTDQNITMIAPSLYPALPQHLFTPLYASVPSPPPPPPPTPKTTPYPPRNPHATRFHHSSAGIDPLGAHNRPVRALRSSVTAGGASCVASPKRIVSGSFGSFENDGDGDRLGEREYRMGVAGERERGEGKGALDKKMAWLRR